MKMIITESDKKLLSFFVAFLIAVLFIFGVFRPLSEKNRQIEQSVAEAKEQELTFDSEATLAQDMSNKEESTREQTAAVLARFYPMLESQEVESMATTLMLNHHLTIQSLSIVMPEINNRLNWYQYSEAAMEQAKGPVSEEETSEEEAFFLYSARVNCVAEGSERDLWNFVDDISENYPAISIASVEWSVEETSGITISLEIFMCNQ